MSFVINMMRNDDPYNKISKNPVSIRQLTGELKDEASIVDPVILIEHRGTLTDCNYAYIPEFQRYYYITNITAVRTNLWRVSMHCDVLKTFSEGILGSPCIVARSSNKFNMLLNDTDYKVFQNPWVLIQNFPNGFDLTQACYLVALIGPKVAV